jgi:hypothetical protein
MRDPRENGRPAGERGSCAHEGYGRRAAGTFCETCELEWFLLHREARPGPKRDSGAGERGDGGSAARR